MKRESQSGATATAERRAQHRYPLQLRVELRPAREDKDAAHTAETSDISATGLYLEGDTALLREGSRVELSVHLPTGADGAGVDLRGVGRIVRVVHQPGQPTGVAVRFDQIEFLADELESFT